MPAEPIKQFTVEQANATLPLVKAIVADIVAMYANISERQERVSHLTGGRDADADDVYSEELSQIQAGITKDSAQLEEFVKELQDIGAHPKDLKAGLVDFPAQQDGRQVWLCWKLGEEEVTHWHEWDEGFSARQTLPQNSSV